MMIYNRMRPQSPLVSKNNQSPVNVKGPYLNKTESKPQIQSKLVRFSQRDDASASSNPCSGTVRVGAM